MLHALFFCVFTSTIFCVFGVPEMDCVPDYYWRDYTGVIPKDAIKAGKDRTGDPIYIGQVYIRNYEFLPGTIYPKKGIIRTTAYDKTFDLEKHVKILCSPHQEAFVWKLIKSSELQGLTQQRRLIPGGSEVGEDLYIGKAFYENGEHVGKVFRHGLSNQGLWILPNHNYVTYSVLTFNCLKVNPDFDVRIGSC